MTKYRVTMLQKVWEQAIILVDAKDEDEAKKNAFAIALSEGVDWDFHAPDDDSLELGDIEEILEIKG